MEKKITVYVVLSNSIESVYATKSRANEAVETLAKFGYESELKQDKKKESVESIFDLSFKSM